MILRIVRGREDCRRCVKGSCRHFYIETPEGRKVRGPYVTRMAAGAERRDIHLGLVELDYPAGPLASRKAV